MKRIGVFVCWCGSNIAGTVRIEEVLEAVRKRPGVVYAADNTYMCSEPGQSLIKKAIVEEKLDGVVVACCSPSLHETTFRRTVSDVGMNPYQCEIANIREQCSWVHRDKDEATKKAINITDSMIEKVRLNSPLEPVAIPITKRALVIGAGISGIQAALDIADGGHEVVLVERSPSIGGRMAQLSETFPTLDCAQCILTPKMVEAGQHPLIKLYAYSEVDEVNGYVGNFKVRIRKKTAYVDWSKCTGCQLCVQKCAIKAPSEFDMNLGKRKVIYSPFPQAVPNKVVIDPENCIRITRGKCGVCEMVCPTKAIDFNQQDSFVEEEVGAIVVATGYDLLGREKLWEYGYGNHPDVIDSLQFERMLSASGPTGGEVRRPSDGKIPKEVVFIQCAGSRDPELGVPYCSKICCMYTAKHAMLYKHKVPKGQAYVFYIDIRAGGKGYEEFVHRVMEEDRALYLRGKVARVFEEDGKLIVWGVDTLTGKKIEIAADLVVLAPAMVPSLGVQDLAQKLRVSIDQNGFFAEAHPKLRPVESLTAGIYYAGCSQSPKDVPESVVQGGSAASKVLALFSKIGVLGEALTAFVDEKLCSGCGICVALCPYDAIELDVEQKRAKINEIICKGCGACVAACPSGAIEQKNLTDEQIYAMVEVIVGGR